MQKKSTEAVSEVVVRFITDLQRAFISLNLHGTR